MADNSPTLDVVNVAARLSAMAERMPDAPAVVQPGKCDSQGKRQYRHLSFKQLDKDSDRIALGLKKLGVVNGTRLALMVRPGINFVSLVFGLFKAGAVTILIDPGMGRKSVIRCLADAKPEGFVAISIVQAMRTVLRGRFPKARLNVTVGRRWFWGGATLQDFRAQPHDGPQMAQTGAGDPAAIIFTTGSTGPPKGVLYSHGNFDAQVEQIRDFYGIKQGEVDLPGFPLFGLFNCAMGVTAVIPDMDPSRPAHVDPAKIIEAVRDWKVTQTFGSPAIWHRVGRYCEEHGEQLSTVRRVLSAGAPVPADVLTKMRACIHPEGEIHTPYGATESLPVASISGSEVLRETNGRTVQGGGVCVGRKFSGIEWKVIKVVDGPIGSIDRVKELPTGEIGELIVRGAVVTRCYVTQTQANAMGKIADVGGIWHRMGDVGYLDSDGRFWFCGRMAHRVLTAEGPMYTVPCEAIFNQHPQIHRSALVGVGSPGKQRPVIVLEPADGEMPTTDSARSRLRAQIRQLAKSNPLTEGIGECLFHPAFPVDIRHNAKIFREKLAIWAAQETEEET